MMKKLNYQHIIDKENMAHSVLIIVLATLLSFNLGGPTNLHDLHYLLPRFFCFKKFMDLGVFFGHLIMPITTSTSLMSRVMIAKGNGHVRFKGLFINDVSPIIHTFALPRPFPSPPCHG